MVKNLPVMQETWVQSLDQAELLEKGIVLEDTREGVKWKKA